MEAYEQTIAGTRGTIEKRSQEAERTADGSKQTAECQHTRRFHDVDLYKLGYRPRAARNEVVSGFTATNFCALWLGAVFAFNLWWWLFLVSNLTRQHNTDRYARNNWRTIINTQQNLFKMNIMLSTVIKILKKYVSLIIFWDTCLLYTSRCV